MAKYSRSEFLRIAGAGAAATGLGFGRARQSQQAQQAQQAEQAEQAGRVGSVDATRPDVALVNGRVLTMDDMLPRADAFAIKSGRFVAIGSNDDIRNIISSETEVIDAGGMTVTPGFIDAHSHPATGGVREITQVNLDVRSIDAIKAAI